MSDLPIYPPNDSDVVIPIDDRVIFACHGEILLNFVPDILLRPLFRACWNRCYPDAPWMDNEESGEDFVYGARFDHFLGTGTVTMHDDQSHVVIDQMTANALKEFKKALTYVERIRVRLLSPETDESVTCWIQHTDKDRWKVDLDADSRQKLQLSIDTSIR